MKVNIGVIGCGAISGIYFKNLENMFDNCQIIAIADKDPQAAKKASEEWNIPILTNEELIEHPEIQIVLNLTTPDSHYKICKQSILAGKHSYTEKPLSLTFAEGKELSDLARQKGLMLGGAPDTFMGAGISTCKKLIDDGEIGQILGAAAFYASPGHESWHPSPEFYYEIGGGPMFDMGPYYLTAMISLIGGVSEISGFATMPSAERTITSQPKHGKKIKVEVPTSLFGILRFENGALGSITTSFDFTTHSHPYLEIYGSSGSLLVPDPNYFDGPVRMAKKGEEYKEIPLAFGFSENSRGLGISDMASCIISGGRPRASDNMTLHVLEIMEGIHVSNDTKGIYKMTTKFQK